MTTKRHAGSFRDPSGFLFHRDGKLYRQVNRTYGETYQRLTDSGLIEQLVGEGLLIPHREESIDLALTPDAYRVLCPERIVFVSYPYEWCFGQLRDAALATLAIQRRALDYGMTLKDASAYNIQFSRGKPLLIDTLSFDVYREGSTWAAYHQFCEHFLGPLLLMSSVDIGLGRLSASYIDGIPLELTSRLLPRRSWMRPSRLLHIHMHARSVRRYERSPARATRVEGRMSRHAMEGLVDSLETAVRRLTWNPVGTEWADYAETHAYSERALGDKKRVVEGMLTGIQPRTVWDLGANIGSFSEIAASLGAQVLALDSDPAATERHYVQLKERGEASVLPLHVDLRNPSSGLGWACRERDALEDRGPADVVLALALVHHLAIGGNVPLNHIAEWFRRLSHRLIVEFVPKDDPQVQRMLATREDVFSEYTRAGFESAFGSHFRIEQAVAVGESGRTLFLMSAESA